LTDVSSISLCNLENDTVQKFEQGFWDPTK
jgi:hypothetical protein